jgi:hypothetical protein
VNFLQLELGVTIIAALCARKCSYATGECLLKRHSLGDTTYLNPALAALVCNLIMRYIEELATRSGRFKPEERPFSTH